MIFAGSGTTIFAKIIEEPIRDIDDPVTSSKDVTMTEFKHPLFMNLLMFGGEALLLLAFAAKLARDPAAKADYRNNAVNPVVFIGPAILDTLGSFLNWTGVYLISASSYVMLRMFQMVAVVFISVTLLDKRYTDFQYLALCVVIAGFLIVGGMDIYNSEDTVVKPDEPYGMVS